MRYNTSNVQVKSKGEKIVESCSKFNKQKKVSVINLFFNTSVLYYKLFYIGI